MMKKDVVILIRNAMPYDFGGGEKVPVYIAREVQAASAYTPIVFSRSQKLLAFAEENSVAHKKTWWWAKQDWSGAKALLFPVYALWQLILFVYYIALFLRYRPSVVHIQSKDDFIAGTFAARCLGIRVIWTDHADLKHIFMNHKIWYKNPIGKMVYLAARFTEKITVVSKADKKLILANIPTSAATDKIKVVYNGAFDSYKKTPKYKHFTFISSGRLVTDKGIGELIDAFDKFHKKFGDTELRILGDGPEKGLFEARAKTNSSIQFLGHMQDPLQDVAKAHVFVMPTYHEGFSLALVEACMLQLPIIATNVGGNPEIIHDRETGLLVKIKDVDDLYYAMVELYKNSALRDTLAVNARNEYLDKFNFSTIIRNEFIAMYEDKK